ncbi:unnamed protein product [Amoebophrya sp. A25]|nr:unnamed protein product [Amoebophrya sp. A25]|eukprot:GSA25T00020503001.1
MSPVLRDKTAAGSYFSSSQTTTGTVEAVPMGHPLPQREILTGCSASSSSSSNASSARRKMSMSPAQEHPSPRREARIFDAMIAAVARSVAKEVERGDIQERESTARTNGTPTTSRTIIMLGGPAPGATQEINQKSRSIGPDVLESAARHFPSFLRRQFFYRETLVARTKPICGKAVGDFMSHVTSYLVVQPDVWINVLILLRRFRAHGGRVDSSNWPLVLLAAAMNAIPGFEDNCPALHEWAYAAKQWPTFDTEYGFEMQHKNVATKPGNNETSKNVMRSWRNENGAKSSTPPTSITTAAVGSLSTSGTNKTSETSQSTTRTTSTATSSSTTCSSSSTCFCMEGLERVVRDSMRPYVSQLMQSKIFSRKNVLKSQLLFLQVLKGRVHVSADDWTNEYEKLVSTQCTETNGKDFCPLSSARKKKSASTTCTEVALHELDEDSSCTPRTVQLPIAGEDTRGQKDSCIHHLREVEASIVQQSYEEEEDSLYSNSSPLLEMNTSSISPSSMENTGEVGAMLSIEEPNTAGVAACGSDVAACTRNSRGTNAEELPSEQDHSFQQHQRLTSNNKSSSVCFSERQEPVVVLPENDATDAPEDEPDAAAALTQYSLSQLTKQLKRSSTAPIHRLFKTQSSFSRTYSSRSLVSLWRERAAMPMFVNEVPGEEPEGALSERRLGQIRDSLDDLSRALGSTQEPYTNGRSYTQEEGGTLGEARGKEGREDHDGGPCARTEEELSVCRAEIYMTTSCECGEQSFEAAMDCCSQHFSTEPRSTTASTAASRQSYISRASALSLCEV